MKRCSRCGEQKPRSEYNRKRSTGDGLQPYCRPCDHAAQKAQRERTAEKHDARTASEDARAIAEADARARRLESDYDNLRPEDFDVSVANDGRHDPEATREKRQEYSRSMGENAGALRRAAEASARGEGDVLDNMPAESGAYIGKLAEQERRFGNRRLARSISLAQAHEALSLRSFKEAARVYLADKVQPTGYAMKPAKGNRKRTLCVLLSDLHFGSDLSALDSPIPFRAVEEARRFEFVLRQVLDYKPQYREQTSLAILLNGDIIEGLLGHDLRDGAPLTEQKVIAWRHLRSFVGYCAQQFPEVRVYCQPGNHGRDKVRHPGRATSRKWDGHEWEIYWGLSQMCSALKNVTWTIDFRAVTAIDLHGSWLGLTHGDTEVKFGDPDTRSMQNAQILDRINSVRIYGVEFAAWAVGHFHKPRFQPRNPRVVYNGALVPPNGYARGEGYIGEPCGQFIWEAVEGYPVGDVRFIEVGPAQDRDERLGSLIQPFRFQEVA